jgi:hypothetical protein
VTGLPFYLLTNLSILLPFTERTNMWTRQTGVCGRSYFGLSSVVPTQYINHFIIHQVYRQVDSTDRRLMLGSRPIPRPTQPICRSYYSFLSIQTGRQHGRENCADLPAFTSTISGIMLKYCNLQSLQIAGQDRQEVALGPDSCAWILLCSC